MAERERFELSRGFLPCTLSKGVPSATRPPFLTNSKTLPKRVHVRKGIFVFNCEMRRINDLILLNSLQIGTLFP